MATKPQHPFKPDETFSISFSDIQELQTHSANASAGAGEGNIARERDAWARFDAVITRVINAHPELQD